MNTEENINSGIDFDSAPGEAFVGLNIIRLSVGQADGPFVVQSIMMKPFGEGARKKDIPQVIATKGNVPYTMPIAAAFIKRLEEAALKKGDTFIIKRDNDYTSRDGTPDCEAYLLKVTARAK